MNRISIKDLQTRIPVHQARIKKVLRQILKYLRFTSADISVVFVTEGHMKRLNACYLKHSYSTDILTFDYRSCVTDRSLHAEIIICPTVARQNASLFKTSAQLEIDRYLVHGILHLCGYDDDTSSKKALMTSLEDRILKTIRPGRREQTQGSRAQSK